MKLLKKNIHIPIIILFLVLSFVFISPAPRKQRSQFHSLQLTKKTERNGDIERIDYVDSNGRITIAADLGYATITLTRNENRTIEQYYDDNGEPISSYNGYYALLREYDDNGNNIRITYLNRDGEPVDMVNGYAVEELEYNETRKVIAIRYYDAEMHPIQTPLYGYGEMYEYNESGQIKRIVYIDDSDTPMITGLGYASVTRDYYSTDGPLKNLVEKEMYFDEAGNPICLKLGQYGLHKEYDKYGRTSVFTYLNANGEPIVTNKGYTTIRRTYHPNGYIATEQYYDLDMKPFSLSEGQYGISQDENQTVYLNRNGKEVFNLKNFIYNHSWVAIPMTILAVLLCSILKKKWCIFFFALYICAILYFTLLFRDNNSAENPGILWSYKRVFTDSEARSDILRNIWLFIPLGIILYRVNQNKLVILVPLVLSVFIESVQLITGKGFCEFDDIISNTLGGAIGFCAEKLTTEYIQRIKSWRHKHTL